MKNGVDRIILSDESRFKSVRYGVTSMPNEIINCTEKPVKTEHVTYYTKADGHFIDLYEVTLVFYPHPSAPKDALIPRLESHRIKSFSAGIFGNGAVYAFNLALNSLREIMSVIGN